MASAMITVTGLGFYELLLNGAKVGDAVLDPGFSTNVTERTLYATYDVTTQVASLTGQRRLVLAARVGAGKYSYSVNPFGVPGRDVFALRAQLVITFAARFDIARAQLHVLNMQNFRAKRSYFLSWSAEVLGAHLGSWGRQRRPSPSRRTAPGRSATRPSYGRTSTCEQDPLHSRQR